MRASQVIAAESPALVIGRRVLVGEVLRGRIDKAVQATEPGRWLLYVAPDRGPLAGWYYAEDCEVLDETR